MQVVRFDCPACSASLKIRGDDIVGRPVDCPECRQPLLVRVDADGNVSVRQPNEPANPVKKRGKGAANPAAATPGAAEKKNPAASLPLPQEGGFRPGNLLAGKSGWVTASIFGVAALALVALAFVLLPRSPKPSTVTKAETPAAADSRRASKPAVPRPAATKPPAPQPVTAASRLTRLGDLLGQYRKHHGNYPAGTSGQEPLRPSERLSWLAELAAGSLFPDRPNPVWFEPWNSLHNDRFVRQQIPEFLNPVVDERVSPQNYPATHFVGVAGVGDDAADLPVDHPRAGIFGYARTTRLEDIHDGASNTLMVLGVTRDLGSWAAGGSATIRPLTHEPYVNGPDGFGTGSTDRMMVLKADGSVAEMSATTDPRIFRRMAAISDGLPLDVNVPGEPGEHSRRPAEPIGPLTSVRAGGPGDGKDSRPQHQSPTTEPTAPASSSGASATETIASRSPVVASRPGHQVAAHAKGNGSAPAVDVEAGLSQHIVRFEQIKPVPLQDVLTFLEELLAVPIRGDRHEIADLDDSLQTPITFQLENTTVRQVLKTVLSKAGLTFEVAPDSIHLHKLETPPARASINP
jgi:hypothetical protein